MKVATIRALVLVMSVAVLASMAIKPSSLHGQDVTVSSTPAANNTSGNSNTNSSNAASPTAGASAPAASGDSGGGSSDKGGGCCG